MRPDQLSTLSKPPQPATDRVRSAPPTVTRSADRPRRRPSPRSPPRSPTTSSWRRSNTPRLAAARACRRTPDTPPAAAATTDPHPGSASTRSRACPHGPNTARHDGHDNAPATRSLSTRACSAHTINMGATPGIQESPPPTPPSWREGSRAFRNAPSLRSPVVRGWLDVKVWWWFGSGSGGGRRRVWVGCC